MGNSEKILQIIVSLSGKYALEAIESVQRNSHMNDLQGNEVITKDNVDKLIAGIVKQANCTDCSKVVSAIELIEYARSLAVSIRENYSDIDQKVVDAILVDFVNFVGISQCVDYGLYTEDLLKQA